MAQGVGGGSGQVCLAALFHGMVPGLRAQKRFSHLAHEDLNHTVTGFITYQRSITDVVQALDKSKEIVGKNEGLAPGSVDAAVLTIKDVLSFRLKEAASETILGGKRKGTAPEIVRRFERSLKDAEASGYMPSDIDLREFHQLLQNLQAKLTAQLGHVGEKVPWLVKELAHNEAENDRARLPDATLTVLTVALLKEMRTDPKAAQKLMHADGLDVVSKLLLGDPKADSPLPPPFHPELQATLALILCEVILAAQPKAKQVHEMRKHVLSTQADKAKHGHEYSAKMGALAQATKHVGESQKAMDILFSALDGAVKRYEHALVWGVLNAIGHLVKDKFICQQILMTGFLPLLQKTSQVYEVLQGRLPHPLPRPGGRDKIFSKVPPAFPSVHRISALEKPGDTVKASWLKTSQSLPSLAMGHRSTVSWLADATSEMDQRFRSTTSSSGAPGQSMNSTFSSSFGQEEFPSVMWLIGEDGVDVESFNRVCDRNFILLKVQRILRNMEKVRSELTGFLQHSNVGKMRSEQSRDSKDAINRGGRSTLGSRQGSRSYQLSRDQLTHSAELSKQMLEEANRKVQEEHIKRQQPPPLTL
mmetsp:Transcript_28513/g.51581  ORF Transcript_28513/g.51581 Transcript_28513/m.51581 type:complete len:589 (+) Transcript_28513:1-1767(+)